MKEKVAFKHKFRVVGGQIEFYDPKRFFNDVKSFEGKDGELALYPKADIDNVSWRGYYFGVMIKPSLKQEMFRGWTDKELHDEVKKFAGIDSTKGMDNEDWYKFVEKGKDFFAAHDIFFEEATNYSENT